MNSRSFPSPSLTRARKVRKVDERDSVVCRYLQNELIGNQKQGNHISSRSFLAGPLIGRKVFKV
jgi:hypothetical protein